MRSYHVAIPELAESRYCYAVVVRRGNDAAGALAPKEDEDA